MPEHSLRSVYVEELIRLAADDARIVSLDSDSREATLADRFAAVHPERSFSFGIAEQDMVSAAGGMAVMGLIPFVNSYAMFIAMRALDQLRNAVAYPALNVKFVLSHHGLDAGADGVTHQLTEDLAIFRTIPNLRVLQPADAVEMVQMVDWAVRTEGPVILKSGKSRVPDVHPADHRFRYGEPSLLADGDEIALVATGVMVQHALEARRVLEHEDGLHARVLNVSSLTDPAVDSILRLTEGVTLVLTVEDHSVHGGLGGLMAELLSSHRPTRIERIGLRDTFAQCGSPDELFREYRMDTDAIVDGVRRCTRRC